MDPVLLIGGAPRLQVDAVRFLSVRASGGTVRRLAADLRSEPAQASAVYTLLSSAVANAAAPQAARRDSHDAVYETRAELELQIQSWLADHPTGHLVCAAAVNDYEVVGIEGIWQGQPTTWMAGQKIPSGAASLKIALGPAPKLIDTMRHQWGFRNRLAACKFEEELTVIESAQRLQKRVSADLVIANSLDGRVQAMVTADEVKRCSDRAQLEQHVADLLRTWISAL